MKRRIRTIAAAILLTAAALGVGFGLGYQIGRQTQPEVVCAPTFYATVTEVRDSTLTVEGLDVNQINYRSAFYLYTDADTEFVWRGTEVDRSDLRPGLTVAVSYTGAVMETYPGQIAEVLRVEILDDSF